MIGPQPAQNVPCSALLSHISHKPAPHLHIAPEVVDSVRQHKLAVIRRAVAPRLGELQVCTDILRQGREGEGGIGRWA